MSFNGQSIAYDQAGNPTSYRGASLSWTRGRLLASYKASGAVASTILAYDANGIRKHKVVPGTNHSTTTEFLYSGNNLLQEKVTVGVAGQSSTTYRAYIYNSQGVMGFVQDGAEYIYHKNIFGDIVAIYQGATKVAEYIYDAWGNHKVLDGNSVEVTDPAHIAHQNPFRYRGYYWDTDLQLYYIQGRYYDPQTASFLDAESVSAMFADSGNPLALDRNGIACVNTFAFAINATNVFTHVEMFADINYDINANKPWWEIAWNAVVNWFAKTIHAITKWYDSIPNWLKFTIGAVCFTIAVVLTILTDGAVLPLFIELGIGVVLSVAVNVISALVTNQDVGAAIWDGIAEGVLWGGITLCISAAIKYFSLPQKIRRSVKKYIDDHAHSLKDANEILSSFEGKIRLKTSRGNLTCYRYYDNIDALARGRYLTNAPTDNPIVDLVLHNNKATYLAKWNLPKGTKYLVGKIARSPTGAIQIFVGDSSWLVLP